MVSIYGMNDKIGNISFYDPQNEGSFQKPYSEETGKVIDQEVKKLSDEAFIRVKKLLTEKKEQVKTIAEELLVKEVLYKDDLVRLIGARPWDDIVLFEETAAEIATEYVSNEPKPETPTTIDDNNTISNS
jgi:cell division protease FtsH